ncbi:hypothetical protein RQP46_004540 [Phenoliferia psychrophenolica]
MSVGPRELALYAVDCSTSMAKPCSFTLGDRTTTVTPLSVMLQYVKAKIAQRIMRDLKRTPLGVLTYCVPKTRNVMTSSMKEADGDRYDKDQDAYRNCAEAIPISYTPEAGMIQHLDSVRAGLGPDAKDPDVSADAHTAIILAMETICKDAKSRNYKKEIVLLTDGESKSDWDAWEGTISRMQENKITLTVIGMNFDDEEAGIVDEDKSEIKAENEKYLKLFTEDSGTFATAAEALAAIAEPVVKEVASQPTKTSLTIGDVAEYPTSSVKIFIELKKAVSPAAVKSMKQMSMRGFQHAATGNTQSQSQHSRPTGDSNHASTGEDGSAGPTNGGGGASFSMGDIGKTYLKTLAEAGLAERMETDSDLLTHGVDRETRWFYRPPEQAMKDKDAAKLATGAPDEEEEEDQPEELRPTGTATLVDAHYYGGSLVETGDMEPGTGMLKGNETGMQVIQFLKRSSIRFDWRLNDPLYVYAAGGYTGSQLLLSTFINAMNESGKVAIVRYIGKGMNSKGIFKVPDPKIGVLFPVTDQPEHCYYCQLPFGEDVRSLQFPSLNNLMNRRGERLEEHKLLPTKPMNDAMASFVDAMDLTGSEDEEGNPSDFFKVEDSFSPAIHNVQNTLVFRLSSLDGELPPVPPILTKYLDPPAEVVAKACEARESAIKAFDVKLVPPKPKKVSKRPVNYDAASAAEPILWDGLFNGPRATTKTANAFSSVPIGSARNVLGDSSAPKPKPEERSQTIAADLKPSPQAPSLPAPPSPSSVMSIVKDEEAEEEDEEPDTEDEDDDVLVFTKLPTTISDQTPLADFDKVLKAHGNVVAVESMLETVAKLVSDSFSTQHYEEAINCLHAAKEASEKSPAGELAFGKARAGLATRFQSDDRKRDFVALMDTEGI